LGGGVSANGYFNPAAFCVAPDVPNSAVVIGPTGPEIPTGYGDVGPGVVLGPGEFNWDISIIKTTPVWGEGRVLQFRTEFYNAFNHPQFGNPVGAFAVGSPLFLPNVDTSTFGEINSTTVNPRIIQFALKFIF
jgi:hypothetical protein